MDAPGAGVFNHFAPATLVGWLVDCGLAWLVGWLIWLAELSEWLVGWLPSGYPGGALSQCVVASARRDARAFRRAHPLSLRYI